MKQLREWSWSEGLALIAIAASSPVWGWTSLRDVSGTRFGDSLYSVSLKGNELRVLPSQKAEAQALRVVDSVNCAHRSDGKDSIALEASCDYLAALYHYIPSETAEEERTQVTGGFALSRKSASSYILAVAKPIEFYPGPVSRRGAAPLNKNPTVKVVPVPQSLLSP